MNDDLTKISNLSYDSYHYYQDWAVDVLRTQGYDGVAYPSEYYDNGHAYFYFRDYANASYKIYAYYTPDQYNINYYWTDNNSVYLNSTKPADVATLPKAEGLEFANDVYAYVTYANSKAYQQVGVSFNQRFNVKTVGMDGYTFNGWFISKTPLSDQTIDRVTANFESYYVESNLGDGKFNITDEGNGSTTSVYYMHWLPNREMLYRYDCDVYAYAYYTPKTYTVNFYYADYDGSANYHDTSRVDAHSSNYNTNSNWVETYHINNWFRRIDSCN
jgi:hypothetical protein